MINLQTPEKQSKATLEADSSALSEAPVEEDSVGADLWESIKDGPASGEKRKADLAGMDADEENVDKKVNPPASSK